MRRNSAIVVKRTALVRRVGSCDDLGAILGAFQARLFAVPVAPTGAAGQKPMNMGF